MDRVLVTGVFGQIGTELTRALRDRHGRDNVLAIDPGFHFVDIAFRSGNGGAAIIRLKVMNPGRYAPLKVYLSTGQLVQ